LEEPKKVGKKFKRRKTDVSTRMVVACNRAPHEKSIGVTHHPKGRDIRYDVNPVPKIKHKGYLIM